MDATLFKRKPAPEPSLQLLMHPESDRDYLHFQALMANGSTPPASAAVPFDANARRFSPVNAWWLADAALLAYWSPEVAAERYRSQAGLQSEFIDRAGTQCYIAWDKAFTIVAFRGTQPNERSDFWTDCDFVPAPWAKGGRVHLGFLEALEPVWNDLLKQLQKRPSKKVWFTGHSLGAALATLAADRFPTTSGVYTFGSPRLGTSDFVSGFNGRHSAHSFRYVNDHDVVTHVPPSAFGFGHVDHERRFAAGGRMIHAASTAAAAVIADAEQFGTRLKAIMLAASTLPPAVLDHTPRRYATFAWNAFVDACLFAGV